MERITRKHLEPLADRFNRITNSPLTPYVKDANGVSRPQAGCYHIEKAYQGWNLLRMDTRGGSGVSQPLSPCTMPARELYNRMHAWLAGYEQAKRTIAEQAICNHSFVFQGRMPCTGVEKCRYCGAIKERNDKP